MATELCTIVARRTQLKPLRYAITYECGGKQVSCDHACEIVGEERLDAEEKRIRGMALNRLDQAHSIEIPLFEEDAHALEMETVDRVIRDNEKKPGRGDIAEQARRHKQHLQETRREG